MYTTYEARTFKLDLLNRIRYDFHVTYHILQYDVVARVVATQPLHERFLIGEIEPNDRVETEQELGERYLQILADIWRYLEKIYLQTLANSYSSHKLQSPSIPSSSPIKTDGPAEWNTLLLTHQDRWASWEENS
jgi:hypothetical protein